MLQPWRISHGPCHFKKVRIVPEAQISLCSARFNARHYWCWKALKELKVLSSFETCATGSCCGAFTAILILVLDHFARKQNYWISWHHIRSACGRSISFTKDVSLFQPRYEHNWNLDCLAHSGNQILWFRVL